MAASNGQVTSVLEQVDLVNQTISSALKSLPSDARGFPAKQQLFDNLRRSYLSAIKSIDSAKVEYNRDARKNATAKANEERREREMNARAAARASGNDNSQQYGYTGYSSGPYNRPFGSGGRRTRRHRNKRHTRRH